MALVTRNSTVSAKEQGSGVNRLHAASKLSSILDQLSRGHGGTRGLYVTYFCDYLIDLASLTTRSPERIGTVFFAVTPEPAQTVHGTH